MLSVTERNIHWECSTSTIRKVQSIVKIGKQQKTGTHTHSNPTKSEEEEKKKRKKKNRNDSSTSTRNRTNDGIDDKTKPNQRH